MRSLLALLFLGALSCGGGSAGAVRPSEGSGDRSGNSGGSHTAEQIDAMLAAGGGSSSRPNGSAPSSSSRPDSDAERVGWTVLLDKDERTALFSILEDGVAFVRVSTTGDVQVVRGCSAKGDYKVQDAGSGLKKRVEEVRSSSDAASYLGGARALAATPSGLDVTVYVAALLRLDTSSSSSPQGSCGLATHSVSALILGAFTVKRGSEVSKEGDPEACERSGVKSNDCRALLAVQLTPVRGGGRASAVPEREKHEETGIVAPH